MLFHLVFSMVVLCKGDLICEDLTKHKNFHLLPDPDHCGQGGSSSVEARIRGGERAKLLEFPWMVFLVVEDAYSVWPLKRLNSSTCGGSLITDRMVITAMHCIVGRNHSRWYITRMYAHIGEWDLSTSVDCSSTNCRTSLRIRVDKIIKHEGYRAHDRHDIALLHLREPVTSFNRQIQPICLPWNCALREKKLQGKPMSFAGWGANERGVHSKVLKKFQGVTQSDAECLEQFKDPKNISVVETFYCVSSNDTETATCDGDSGGPLMYSTNLLHPRGENRTVLTGILTTGWLCDASRPDWENIKRKATSVFLDVAYYMKWILDHLEGPNKNMNAETYVFDCLNLTNHKNFRLLPSLKYCGQTEQLWRQFPEEFNDTLYLQVVQARIRGGSRTQLREFPWLAFINITIGFFELTLKDEVSSCGGSLINENYVLSAAHCFRPAPPNHDAINTYFLNADVYLGEYARPRTDDDPGQVDCMSSPDTGVIRCNPPVVKRSVSKFIVHPFFDARTKINDIALLRLKLPYGRYNAFIMPVCLPWSCNVKASAWMNYNVAMAGWGSGVLLERDSWPDEMKKYNASIMNRTECEEIWNEVKLESQMCTRRERAGACEGDAGGPGVMLTPLLGPQWSHRFVQLGIFSYGPPCVPPTEEEEVRRWRTLPDVFTNVSFHMKWILDTIVP